VLQTLYYTNQLQYKGTKMKTHAANYLNETPSITKSLQFILRRLVKKIPGTIRSYLEKCHANRRINIADENYQRRLQQDQQQNILKNLPLGEMQWLGLHKMMD
jgi:hypothetical protein